MYIVSSSLSGATLFTSSLSQYLIVRNRLVAQNEGEKEAFASTWALYSLVCTYVLTFLGICSQVSSPCEA